MLAVAAGLFTYALLLRLPRYSPRQQMIRRLGPEKVERPGDRSALARRLRQVPATRRLSPRRFRLMQAALAGGALLFFGGPTLLFGAAPDPAALLFYPVLLWALPALWLRLQIRRRRVLLARAYPDLLAHLSAQTLAGAGTLQAFATSPPVLREPLRGEVEELIADIRISPFPAALERFALRCDIPELRAFAGNVIYQQSLGISLGEVLAAEEAHALAMARQAARQRIQTSAVTMAAVTVILLLNGLLIYFTPILMDLSKMVTLQ